MVSYIGYVFPDKKINKEERLRRAREAFKYRFKQEPTEEFIGPLEQPLIVRENEIYFLVPEKRV